MPRTKAAIPAANFVPPSRLNGLVLSIQDPDGDLVIDFAAMRGPKNLVQETAEAFAYLTGDLGPWHSAMTARTSLDGIRAFLKWAVDRKVLRCYAELTPAVWNRWRTYCANTYIPATAGAYLRRLRLVAQAVPGLPERTREVIRWPMEYQERDQLSYTLDQFLAIRRAAYAVVRAAHERITANYALTRRPPEEWEPAERPRAEALLQILRDGLPTDRTGYAALGAITAANAQAKGLARAQLFLTDEETYAAAALLISHEGSNPSTLSRYSVADSQANLGGVNTIYTVAVEKRRRKSRARFTATHVDRGTGSAGEAWRLIEEATAPAREHLRHCGIPGGKLFIWCGQNSSVRTGLPRCDHFAERTSWWATQDGLPRLSLRTLHRTYQTVYRKQPTHNTRRTHESRYLLLDGAARAAAMRDDIAAQQRAADEHASSVRMRMTDTPIEPAKDTSLAACEDIHHHPDTGELCRPTSFFLCLLCPNAVAAPRHLPYLVLLLDELDILRPSLVTEDWTARFAEHHALLHGFLRKNASAAEINEARKRITDRDRRQAELMISGRFNR